MITISFYSYKGGVGRSLALTNLGVYLAQFGATVAMVDFDLEAPGLQYKIRPDVPIDVENRGIAGLLADLSHNKPIASLDWDLAIDVSEHTEMPEAGAGRLEQSHGKLLLVPAGNPVLPQYWHDLAAIAWNQLFTGSVRPGVAALAQLKERLVKQYSPDVLLVDSRTGITPGGGVSTTLLPDVVVMMMLNTAEHLDGTRLVMSAIASSGGNDRPPPTVVPVLSRYTSPRLTVPRLPGRIRQHAPLNTLEPSEQIPLDELWLAIARDMPDTVVERIKGPQVLHTDLSLQHHERLAFGPYASSGSGGTGQALLEDYLRLFAALVPQEMFLRYLTGVRNRVRSILLDDPDDAVRTLESLATLVGDEAAFVDLVKVYVLRRDIRNMLLAADRLFRVHKRIVAHPALSQELRGLFVRPAGRPSVDVSVDVEFAERYWREVAASDVEWGAGIARFLADSAQADRAQVLADELIRGRDNAETLAQVVRIISSGGSRAETLAVQLASQYFEAGHASSDFLNAAANACRYHPTPDLAKRILDAPASTTIPEAATIDLLQTAGRYEEAGTLFIEAVTTAEQLEGSLDRYAQDWDKLVRRLPELKEELRRRNPNILEYLESARDVA